VRGQKDRIGTGSDGVPALNQTEPNCLYRNKIPQFGRAEPRIGKRLQGSENYFDSKVQLAEGGKNSGGRGGRRKEDPDQSPAFATSGDDTFTKGPEKQKD